MSIQEQLEAFNANLARLRLSSRRGNDFDVQVTMSGLYQAHERVLEELEYLKSKNTEEAA